MKKEAKQKDRNKNEEKNHYISRINVHWQLAAETAQARQKHRVLHRQRQLLKHRYRPKKHRRQRVQRKRPQTQRQQKPLQHWKMERTLLILIQTAVCSRSMKCMMEKEL